MLHEVFLVVVLKKKSDYIFMKHMGLSGSLQQRNNNKTKPGGNGK